MLVLVAAASLVRWTGQVVTDTSAAVLSGAPVRPDEVLSAVTAAVALALAAWLGLGVVLELLASAPGVVGDAARTASAAVSPRVVRRAVGLVLGVGVAAGLSPGASLAAVPVVRVVQAEGTLPDPGFAPLPDPGWPGGRDHQGSAPVSTASGGVRSTEAAPSPKPVPSTSPAAATSGTTPVRTPTRTPTRKPPEATTRPHSTSPPPATPAPRPRPTLRTAPDAVVPEPGWVAPIPTVRPQPDVRLLGPAPRSPRAGEIVVRRGDTLWSIAARHLGTRPSDSEIARAWPTWYDANRDVIGDDPGLLLPGQVLRAPSSVTP